MRIATTWNLRTNGITLTFVRDPTNNCWKRECANDHTLHIEMTHNQSGWYWCMCDTQGALLTVGMYSPTRIECARDLAMRIVDRLVVSAAWKNDHRVYIPS